MLLVGRKGHFGRDRRRGCPSPIRPTCASGCCWLGKPACRRQSSPGALASVSRRCTSGASRRAPRADAVPSRTPAVARWGSMRRARRSSGRWWRSGTIARWTNTESCWRYAAAGRRSAGRPCAGPCGGSGYGAKKDAARQRARSRRHPSGAGGLLRTDAAARRQELGLPRRERHYHGDDPSLCPRAAGREGTRLSPGRLATADRPGGALRRGHDRGHEHPGSHHHAGSSGFLTSRADPRTAPPSSNATVLMDNLSAHKPKAVETALTKAGFKLLYLPRYSPDLSPIEPGWSKLKSVLRTAEARTRETLEAALAPALDSITPADARGWFNHCGYSFPD